MVDMVDYFSLSFLPFFSSEIPHTVGVSHHYWFHLLCVLCLIFLSLPFTHITYPVYWYILKLFKEMSVKSYMIDLSHPPLSSSVLNKLVLVCPVLLFSPSHLPPDSCLYTHAKLKAWSLQQLFKYAQETLSERHWREGVFACSFRAGSCGIAVVSACTLKSCFPVC